MNRYTSHSSYKPSTIPWVDRIPSHWDDVRARFVARLETGHTPDRDEKGYWEDGDIPWFSLSDMDRVRQSGSKYVQETNECITKSGLENASTRLLPEGTVILSRTATIGFSCILDVEAATDQSMVNWVCGDNLQPEYLYYVFQSMQEELDRLSEGSTHKSIYMPDVRSIKIPLPPKTEQESITRFIEDRVSSIDELLAKHKSLLYRVRDRSTTLKRQAVTEGISDWNKSKSDSGVGWIGKTPTDWEVIRTRFVARLESGHTPSKSKDEYWTEADIPWVSLADSDRLRNNDYISDTTKHTNEKGLANSSAHILPEKTVVMTRDATVGLCSIIERPMAVSQHIVGWVCGSDILPEYLLYVLQSMDEEFDRLTRGSTISTIGMRDIESFKTPLPPVHEQREIVQHIQSESERMDELIRKVEATIDLLEKKRKGLIAAAVTGQINVTETQNPELETTT